MRGGTTDVGVYENLLKGLNTKLDVYDKILSKQKYLAGNVSLPSVQLRYRPNERSLGAHAGGSIPHSLRCHARHSWERSHDIEAQRQEVQYSIFLHVPTFSCLVQRWFEEISARPSWQEVKGGVKSSV
jgi:hypothetical protein